MIQASRSVTAAPHHLALARRRPVRTFGTRAYAVPLSLPEEAVSPWPVSRSDLTFFLSCYAAGLAFFLIMLT